MARFLWFVLAILLSACGGGGGDSGTPALGGSSTALFTSAPASLTVQVGRAAEFAISGGRAPYTVSSSDASTAATGLQGATAFVISGVKGGSATITVKDAAGAATAISVTVGSGTALFTTAPAQVVLAAGAVQSFNIGGGAGPYSVASSNAATATAQISASGASFSLSAQGSGATTVVVSDARGSTVSIDVTVGSGQGNVALFTSAANPLVIGVGTVPSFSIGGGTGPYVATSSNEGVARAVVTGSSLSITGVASGTASIQVTDASGGRVSISVTVGSAEVVALYTTAPSGLVLSKGVTQTYSIGGGVGPYTASSGNNSLVSASVSGSVLSLSGIGLGTASVSVFDALGRTVSISLTVNAAAALSTSAPESLVLSPGSSGTYKIIGGAEPYQVVSSNSSVATASVVGDAFTIGAVLPGSAQITIRDASGSRLTIAVSNTAAPLALSTPATLAMSVGSLRTVQVAGGVPPYRVGSSNEAVLTASAAGSVVTLAPLASGAANIAITDAAGDSISVSVSVGAAADLFTTAPASLNLGQGVSQTFTILGGRSPYYVATGNPATVSASVAGSTLTVTGGAPGSGTIAVRDSMGATVTVAVTVGNQTPLYTSATSTVVMASGVQRTFVVDGGAPTYVGGVPAYLVTSSDPAVATATVTGNTLVVSSVAGGTSQVVVTDSLGSRVTFQVTVGGAVDLHTTAPSSVTLSPGVANAQTYEIRGGAAPYTVTSGSTAVATAAVAGNLLTITGVSSGSAVVQVTDRLGATVLVSASVVMSSSAASPLTVTPVSATGAVGDVIRFEVRGGSPVYTATVANQNVAAAASFGSSSAFTVQLTSVGSSNVAVIDSSGQVQNVTVTAQSSLSTPLFTSAPPQVSMSVGAPSTFTVGGGTGTYAFSSSDVSVVAVPAVSSTQLVLTPVAVGTATVSVTDTVGAKLTLEVLVGGVQPLRLSAGTAVTLGLSAGPATYAILGGRMNYTAVSTNRSVVDVNPPGATANLVITPVAAGTANVVVTDSAGTQVTLGVTVTQSGVQAMVVSPASASANVGDELVFSVVGGTTPYTFTVTNSSVVSRTSLSPGLSPGVFRMVGAGTTNMTVTDAAGQIQEVTITATQAATQLRVSPTTLILPETFQLGAADAPSNLLLNIYGGAGSTFTPYSSDPTRVAVKIVNTNKIQLFEGSSRTLCSNADVTRYALGNVAVNDPTQPAAANVFDIVITVVDQTGASATAKLVILDDGADLDPLGDCR